MQIDPVSIFLRGIFGPGFPLWVDLCGSYCTQKTSIPMLTEDIERLKYAQDAASACPIVYDYKACAREVPSGSG